MIGGPLLCFSYYHYIYTWESQEAAKTKKRMLMLEELYKKESYGIMKRRAEDQILWRGWMATTCQWAEQ